MIVGMLENAERSSYSLMCIVFGAHCVDTMSRHGEPGILSALTGLADAAATPSTEGVGWATTLTRRSVSLLPGLKQSVYRAEFLGVVRALEECQAHEVVSDCKGVVHAVQALQTGRRRPKGRNRDLEQR
eukprot:3091638-Amphidinium_carterae.1